MACNFSSLIRPDGSAPAALRSHKPLEKHSVTRLSYLFAHLHLLSFETFSCLIFFLLLFSSPTLPISAFHLSILSEVWLLNFLRIPLSLSLVMGQVQSMPWPCACCLGTHRISPKHHLYPVASIPTSNTQTQRAPKGAKGPHRKTWKNRAYSLVSLATQLGFMRLSPLAGRPRRLAREPEPGTHYMGWSMVELGGTNLLSF